MRESDLSSLTVKYFQDLGYQVNCEVNDIDIVARKDEYLVAIELKLSFNMTLLFQVMDRLNFADEVYVALPKPKRRSKDLTKIRKLAELLNFGVLFVDDGVAQHVEALYVPISKSRPRDNKRKLRASIETDGRSIELNQGGTNNVKIVTAYREKCLAIASIIHIRGEISAQELRYEYGFEKGITTALKKNYYKWFEEKELKRFALTESALTEIKESPEFNRLFNAYLKLHKPSANDVKE